MKITMMMTEDAIQFNLEPESEHEKDFMKGLSKYKGVVSISNGVSVGMSHGGYLRNYGEEERVTAITIYKSMPTECHIDP